MVKKMSLKFIEHTGIVAPININNIDTDVIIPKQFLQKIHRKGFGKYLFYDWKYFMGNMKIKNTNFILNNPIFNKSTILLTGPNFGCGSSREHALWALTDYGFKAIISSSFADIFYKNAINNRLLPIILKEKEITDLFNFILKDKCAKKIYINLKKKFINIINQKKRYNFEINNFDLKCIMYGIDHISTTLSLNKKIKSWEDKQFDFLK